MPTAATATSSIHFDAISASDNSSGGRAVVEFSVAIVEAGVCRTAKMRILR